jgi:hypothetical protein
MVAAVAVLPVRGELHIRPADPTLLPGHPDQPAHALFDGERQQFLDPL